MLSAPEYNRNPVFFGNAKFSIYSVSALRAEYRKNRDFPKFPSILTETRPPKKALFRLQKSKNRLILKTKELTLIYCEKGKGFTKDSLSIKFKINGKTKIFYPGQEPEGVLSYHQRSFDEWPIILKRYRHRGHLNRCGWNVIEDKEQVYLTKEGWLKNKKGKTSKDFYFFVYGNNYKKAMLDYIKIFGKIPLLPEWTFGLWFSRYFKFTDKQLLGLIERFKNENIPLDVLVIDTEWRKFEWRGYEWNKKLFPHPIKFLKKLEKLKIKIGLNDHPGYNHIELLADEENLSKKIRKVQDKQKAHLDFSSKEITDIWLKEGLTPLIREGIDFWWVDGWGYNGPVKGVDRQLWLNKLYTQTFTKNSTKRPLIISRWGGIGSHRYPFPFSGDIASTWANLKKQIKVQAEGFNAASAYISFDLGGFFGKPLKPHRGRKLKKDETLSFNCVYKKKIDTELFIRWMELGAFSPIMRLHSHRGIREPWRYGKRALEIFKKYTKVRYRLFPYIYNLSSQAHTKGISPIRPLYVEYSKDPHAYKYPGQYLFGENLLIIPADSSAKNGYSAKMAYFPQGEWIDIESGEIVKGKCFKTLCIPIDKIPVFAKAGSAIPLKKATDRIAQKSDLILEVYPQETKKDKLSLKIINKRPECAFLNIFIGDRKPLKVKVNDKLVSFEKRSSQIVCGAIEKKYIYIKPKIKKRTLHVEILKAEA